jgi:hypothetical protein
MDHLEWSEAGDDKPQQQSRVRIDPSSFIFNRKSNFNDLKLVTGKAE